MVTILLKTMVDSNPNNRTNLLEKILTGLIIVLTKEHHCNPNNFNCKLFFKLLFNILYVRLAHPRTSTDPTMTSRRTLSRCFRRSSRRCTFCNRSSIQASPSPGCSW
jgi:hypothetical protein